MLFLIIYLLVRVTGAAYPLPGTIPQRERTPEDILDERYARGELTREQYLLMRDDIRRPGTALPEGEKDKS